MHLASPPSLEIVGRNVNPQVFECLGAQVTIVRPLYAGIRVIPHAIGLNSRRREAHDLPKYLAYLVLGELVLTRELEDLGQRASVFCLEILSRNVWRFRDQRLLRDLGRGWDSTVAHPSYVFGVGWVPERPVVHFRLDSFGLGLPNRLHEDIHSTLGRRLGVAVENRDS